MAQIITINKEDEFFPEAFKAIGEDCPERIYAMGNLDLLKREHMVAIIGSRKATRTGNSKAYNLGISYAFQKPVAFKGLKVIDLLTLASGRGTSLSEACDYLSEVGLCARDYIDRELNDSLSGGEMKRIEIAMMLARSTALSLFDEPEAGIDLWSFQSLIQVFEKMNEKTNGKILIISHQERILNIADRIIMMQDGKVVRDGKPDDVMPHIIGSGCTKIMDKLAK